MKHRFSCQLKDDEISNLPNKFYYILIENSPDCSLSNKYLYNFIKSIELKIYTEKFRVSFYKIRNRIKSELSQYICLLIHIDTDSWL